jgi:phosphopantetheine--protein transferase-like protein
MINWRSTYAIYRNELMRFMRTVFGSLVSPVLTTSLYFIVFGAAIGGRMNAVGGVDYGAFIVPGLIMLTVLMQSVSNASFGIYFPKFSGTIYEILSAPISPLETVAGYVGAAPESLEFTAGDHGKPALADSSPGRASGVEFNLSHSDDLALVAVARGRAVGVDVERWSPETEHLELAERFFSPAERDALRALAGSREQVIAGFFAAWSRKEAYLKATGTGLAGGLSRMSFVFDSDAEFRFERADDVDAARWQFNQFEIGLEHVLAVALLPSAHIARPRVSLREFRVD